MSRCRNGGALVGGKDWYPSAPVDHAWANIDVPIACNHLRCEVCGQTVTQRVTGFVRSYSCACGGEGISGMRWLDAGWGMGPDSPYAWACGGHPELTVPGELDGHTIDGGDGVAALARAGLEGRVPLPWQGCEPAAMWARHPGFWVARLYALVPGETDAGGGRRVQRASDARRPIVATCEVALDDPSAEVRQRAACFFEHHPVSTRIADLVMAELAVPTRWLGAPSSQASGHGLWDMLLEALVTRGNVEGPGGPALDAALAALKAGHGSQNLVFLMGRKEPQRLAHAAAAIVAAGAAVDIVLLGVNKSADAAEIAVRELAAAGVRDLAALVDANLRGEVHERARQQLG